MTEIDRDAECELVAVIRATRPVDGIIGEEGTNLCGDSGVRWIIDPLDGTTNFVHRYPAHSVAVGVEINGRRTIGEVLPNPLLVVANAKLTVSLVSILTEAGVLRAC